MSIYRASMTDEEIKDLAGPQVSYRAVKDSKKVIENELNTLKNVAKDKEQHAMKKSCAQIYLSLFIDAIKHKDSIEKKYDISITFKIVEHGIHVCFLAEPYSVGRLISYNELLNSNIENIIIYEIDSMLEFYKSKKHNVKLNSTPKVELTNGNPLTDDHKEIDPVTGQQKSYVVLSKEERDKGFTRPYRDTYVHKTCGYSTKMSVSIAETFARDPSFYTGTFCSHCVKHLPLNEFLWNNSNEEVGS